MRALFRDAPRGAKLGKITPSYMLGAPQVSVPEVAQRMHRTFPDVRLVALLRDPVDRAHSAYRMAVREDAERRSFERAIEDLLDPAELERARRGPEEEASYVVGWEYGRMLAAYLEVFDRGQLHIELTSELERGPGDVVRRVCEFIGVRPHTPERLGERFYPGGRPLLPAQAEADLKAYLEREVWPRMRHAEQHRFAFETWFRLWNSEATPPAEPVDPDTAAKLRDHYRDDARALEAATGVRVPWAAE